ncbi:ferritin heavy chain B-like isoform X2 [Cetorhinus maximus]
MGRLWSLLPGLLLGLQSGRRLLHPFQCPPCCSPAAGRLWRGPQVHGGGQAGQCQGRGRGQSQSRQNYPSKCEDGINSQINLELSASYVYLSMSYYFDRDDVALKNFAKFYLEQSLEEQEHAAKLMKFQNQRGGRIILKDIKLCEFLESNYLNEQIEAIKKLGDHITNLKRLGAPENGMGEYLFDKHTLGESS